VIDVLISGGMVVDGSGDAPFAADVAVQGGRVAEVGRLPQDAEAAERIDATGMLVTPGFIDAHVHLEGELQRDPAVLPMLRQGVTTAIVGQDGTSLAPGTKATVRHMARYFAAINGAMPPTARAHTSVADMLADLDGAAINAAYLVPNGNLRLDVVGSAMRAARPDEVRAMQRLAQQGMADGAIGLSTGLDYIPSRYADTAEIIALCRAIAGSGGVYVTHMRGYGDRAPAGVAEVYEIAREAGLAVHISHYSGPAEIHLPLIEAGLAEGLRVTFDAYPYSASSTTLAMLLLPAWVQEGEIDDVVERLADSGVRARLDQEWGGGDAPAFHRITVSAVAAESHRWMEGLKLHEAAGRSGTDVTSLVCDVLGASDLAVGGVLERDTYTESDIRAMLRHDVHMAGSDGVHVGSRPHPRAYGTFARLLGVHTRDLGDWNWVGAVTHLATRAAGTFGLADRGRLAPGMAADVVVFDPATIRDHATYADPRRLSDGVEHVLVNGVRVLADGEPTGARPGRALRPGR
jgi:N-acyl-D-amino-acid deacylase